jgi:type I restriction enzyme R subunit
VDLIVDIWSKEVTQNNVRNAIESCSFDVLRDEIGIDVPQEGLDNPEPRVIDYAWSRFTA